MSDTELKSCMTLDEAIEHCREKADCTKCGMEHQQLAEWLIELKSRRNAMERIVEQIVEQKQIVEKMKERFLIGKAVHRQGNDESDAIACPYCGYEVARNDDFDELKPKHCPDCGTKLLY